MDKSLTNAELRATAASLRMKPERHHADFRTDGKKERSVKGQRGYTIDRAKLAELSDALRKDTMADYVKKYPQADRRPLMDG